MTKMTGALCLCLLGAAAHAGATPIASQTLEALRSAAVATNPAGTNESAAAVSGSFFDGSTPGVSIAALTPIAFKSLPPSGSVGTGFSDRVPMAGVHVHVPARHPESRASSGMSRGSLAAAGVGLIVTGLLIGGGVALPLAVIGGALLLAAAGLFLAR